MVAFLCNLKSNRELEWPHLQGKASGALGSEGDFGRLHEARRVKGWLTEQADCCVKESPLATGAA